MGTYGVYLLAFIDAGFSCIAQMYGGKWECLWALVEILGCFVHVG